MLRSITHKCLILLLAFFVFANGKGQENENSMRVLIIGAHPDDAEKAGGTAALYTQNGHIVQLVSVTNGNKGHQAQGGAMLANRRIAEAKKSGEVIGAEYIVMNNNDGELIPSLENRLEIIRVIRTFKPDIIFTHRPNDYHPDHRYTSILVQDAAYMIMVPNVAPEVPPLKKNPVIFYMHDRFQKPGPFEPDVVIHIDNVVVQKLEMYHSHTSQMYEWLPWIAGYLEEVPDGEAERKQWLMEKRSPGWSQIADQYRDLLIQQYGERKGKTIKFAEAFEACEYGGRYHSDDREKFFPF